MTDLEGRVVPATLPGLFSTGVDDGGQPLPAGSIDAHYSIASAPAGAAAGAAAVTNPGFPFPYWAANAGGAAWLSPRADENGPDSDPAGVYTYETSFDLTGLDPATASISGTLYADNHVQQILLNGVAVGGFASNGGGSDFASGVSLSVTSGFLDGTNTLEFVVLNDAGSTYNPSGFRADFSGGGALPALSESATGFDVFSTGVAADGTLLGAGQADPHYAITGAPAGGTTGPASVTLAGYPFTGVSPAWAANGGGGQWVSPHADQDSTPGASGVSEPAGVWTYTTTFDLAGFDPATARLTGRVSADNTLTQVLLNGQDTGYASSGGTTDFATLRQLVVSSGFQAGVNTLTFVANNADDSTRNASGLRAELAGTAVPLSIAASGVRVLYVGAPLSLTESRLGLSSVTSVTQPAHGSVAATGTTVVYSGTPVDVEDVLPTSDTFTVTGPAADGSQQTVTVTVVWQPVSDEVPAPVAGPAAPPAPVPPFTDISQVIAQLSKDPAAKAILDAAKANGVKIISDKTDTGASWSQIENDGKGLIRIDPNPALNANLDVATGNLLYELLRAQASVELSALDKKVSTGIIRMASDYADQSEVLTYKYGKDHATIAAAAVAANNWNARSDLFSVAVKPGGGSGKLLLNSWPWKNK